MTRSSERCWAFVLLLATATFLAYQPSWNGKPLWDDDMHITRPQLRSLEGLARMWTNPRATAQYYPLLHTVFWVEHKLWGDWTTRYHLANISLHLVSALFFLALLRRLAIPGAWLAACIFALHPVHVESVAWITELKNTLSTVLYLAAFWFYLEFDSSRARRAYGLALLLFVAALLTKTVTGTLPAALLVTFWWKRGRLACRDDVLPLAPFFLLGALGGMMTAWWELEVNLTREPAFAFTWVERILIAGRALWFQLAKLLFPAGLCFSYPRWRINLGQWWQYLFPLGVVAVLPVLWWLRRWSRGPLAAWLFYAATLFPTLGFFSLYTFRYSFVADHYQYAASLGVIALVAAGTAQGFGRWGPGQGPARLEYGTGLALLALLAGLTWRQAHLYANSETLWKATLAKNPSAWIAHSNLGWDLLKANKPEAAIGHFESALRIEPRAHEVENNWGLALEMLGRPAAEAEKHFQACLRLNPQFGNAHYNYANLLFREGRLEEAVDHFSAALRASVRDRGLDPALHNNFGSALARLGKLDEAVSHYKQSLRLKLDGITWKNLGMARLDQGRPEDAIKSFEASLQATNTAEVHYELGLVFYQRRRSAEALDHWRQALKLGPQEVQILNSLAWGLATSADQKLRNGAEAVQLAERACALPGGDEASSLDTLAAACAEAGRFEDAIKAAERAITLAEAAQQTNSLAKFRARLELYRQHRAYHEPP